MRAWIARDGCGICLYASDPKWIESQRIWVGLNVGAPEKWLRQIAKELPMNHKQQIELTARPVGEAEGGEG